MAKKFTDEEINNIIIDYKNGMRPYELAKKYDRNSSSIINKLKELNVYIDSRYHFTKEDEDFLREHYPCSEWDVILTRFKNLSKEAIIKKANKLEIKRENYFWKDEDIDFLKTHYKEYSSNELYEIFNHKYSLVAIRTQAYKYGLSIDDDWTDDEDNILREYYSTSSYDDYKVFLPHRTLFAIKLRANKLGLDSLYKSKYIWTDEETNFLVNNWQEMSDEKIAQFIDKPKRSILDKRNRIGLFRIDKEHTKYADLNKYLRGQISDWKNASMQMCDYKCVLTGSKEFQIHHLYSFNQIIRDMFENNNNIIEKDFREYSLQELNEILELFIIEQNKHPLGVCLRKDLHDLFHSIYGRIGNSESQWLEFKEDYQNGVYKTIIALG